MNSLIKELAERAGLEMCSCGCNLPTRQAAKFAELIVRECKMQIVKCACELELDANPFVDKITEHFKV